MEKTVLQPCNIIGIAIKTSNINQQSAGDIARLWERFWSENIISQIPGKISDDLYGVYTEYEGDFTQPYTTVIGCVTNSLDNIPEGMVGITIEGGQYMKSVVRGKLSDGIVVQEWEKIWQIDMPRKYKTDFEVYLARNNNPDDMEVDIFVGIE